MQTAVSPLTARAQALVTALLGMMAVMGFAPLCQVLAQRWPLRFSESPWRYYTFVMALSDGPQLVILLSIIAVLALLTGYRKAVRAVAIVLGLVAIVHVVILPFFLLDYFQVRRLIGLGGLGPFKAMALKTLLVAMVVTAAAAWGAFWAWRASENESAGQRRQKGEGLVVGQPKAAQPTTG